MTKYNIGDKLYFVTHDSVERRVTCPCCFGKKYVTIIVGDGTEHTLDCEECRSGYDPPRGYVIRHDSEYTVRNVTIGRVEQHHEKTEYGVDCSECSWYRAEEADLFTDPFEAQKEVLVRQQAEDERIKEQETKKFDPRKTWGWHVSYYRKMLNNAQRDIETATRKLNAAKEHVK